jgi:hypothetical protein
MNNYILNINYEDRKNLCKMRTDSVYIFVQYISQSMVILTSKEKMKLTNCKFDNIDINIIQDNNNFHKKSSFNKDIKQQLKQKYEELFFDKLVKSVPNQIGPKSNRPQSNRPQVKSAPFLLFTIVNMQS